MGKLQVWSEEENLNLVSAWIKLSQDPIVGKGQKGETFFKRIHEEWLSRPGSNSKYVFSRLHTIGVFVAISCLIIDAHVLP